MTTPPLPPTRPCSTPWPRATKRRSTQGLRLSGEGPEYFAERRIAWTARLLHGRSSPARARLRLRRRARGAAARRALCSRRPLWGFDPSTAAIDRARQRLREAIAFGSRPTRADLPTGEFDLAYCNGVFHHIAAGRSPGGAATVVGSRLRPGGWFALWENNPWNPGTRWVMRRIPFDRDAVDAVADRRSPDACARRAFASMRTDAWFLFPHALALAAAAGVARASPAAGRAVPGARAEAAGE